ncbi:MAG TPA: serine/threonine-protein kinase [Vicinamibacterales bacterium]|nr:serine/threonine-protein kinase [Vicinamibacterales bacterium]
MEAFAEWWCVTSLWHDWGYPFETTEFIADARVREMLLQELTEQINRDAFATVVGSHARRELSREELRRVHQETRFVPLELRNAADVFSSADVDSIDQFFWRIGLDRSRRPVPSLIDLTTQAPKGRPPYYDHGLGGACLLERWWKEADRFALEMARSNGIAEVLSRAVKDSIAIEFVEMDGLFHAATEAIAYHNLDFRQWTPADLERVLRPGTAPAKPGLLREPHLFFVSLIDTLQDWDRAHYVPLGEASYRPAVPSSQMMIQAVDEGLRVFVPGSDPVAKVRKQFDSWLDEKSCTDLFLPDPNFTLEHSVYAAEAITLGDASASRIVLARAIVELQRVTEETKKLLVTSPDDGLRVTCSQLDAMQQTVSYWKMSMLPGELDSLHSHAGWQKYVSLQKVVGGLIGNGSQLPRGQITQKLGEGGFGTVYAVHGGAPEPVAYKVYHASELDNDPKRRLFRRGYDAMHKIGLYPGVVQVYEFTQFPVGFFMELIRGKDLQETGISLGDAHVRVRALENIAETLAFAHSRDVIHRDVKPANVIVRDLDMRPVLTDFDLAWVSGRSTITGAAYASMIYGAPEQFDSKLATYQVRPTVDVYSFGALAHFLLSGREPLPFYSSSAESITQAVTERLSGELVATSVDSLAQLVAQCLRRDPAERPATMGTVLDRLRRIKLQSVDNDNILRVAPFLREVEIGTGLLFTDGKACSHTGRVRIELDGRQAGTDEVDVLIHVSLVGLPSYNVISHDEYRRAVIKRLRTIAAKYAGRLASKQHPSVSDVTMHSWSLKIVQVPSTAQRAWTMSDCIQECIAAVE